MRVLQIMNDGEIEPGALSLLGASTKDGDATKIGFFGSGNKYAIATLLRENVPFAIFSGTRRVEIATRAVTLNGCIFDQIILDNDPTSFTTRMGPDWKVWFAIREFISNAKDEGGFALHVFYTPPDQVLIGEPGKTCIYITIVEGGEVALFCESMSKYILDSDEPVLDSVELQEEGFVQILEHATDETFNVYRKGISVRTPDEIRSLYRYNFDKLEINESRTVKYDFQVRQGIARALSKCKDAGIVERVLNNERNPNYVESMAYWQYVDTSYQNPLWIQYFGNKTIYAQGALQFLPAGDELSGIVVSDNLFKYLTRAYPDLYYFNQAADFVYVDMATLSAEQCATYDEAIKEVKQHSYYAEDIAYRIVDFIDPTVLGCFNRDDRMIRLSVSLLNDKDELITTLIEEFIHYLGYGDGTRGMEQFLIQRLLEGLRETAKLNAIKEVLNG